MSGNIFINLLFVVVWMLAMIACLPAALSHKDKPKMPRSPLGHGKR